MPACTRRADGKPKVAYATKDDADEANHDWKMHPYQCRRCGLWHLGHQLPMRLMTQQLAAAQRGRIFRRP